MDSPCSRLDTRTGFPQYVDLLYNASAGRLDTLEDCRPEICRALWGTGNPDISGIGVGAYRIREYQNSHVQVVVAYGVELFLALLLAACLMCLSNPWACDAGSHRTKLLRKVIEESISSYADAAFLVTFSTQIAAVILLIRKDFGISAVDLGDFTIEVIWAVAVVTMLPVVLISFSSTVTLPRPRLQFGILCVSWLLFMYIFLSRMINNFGPSQIGSGGGAVISNEDFEIIVEMCFAGKKPSTSEDFAFQFFAVTASLLLSLPIVGRLTWSVATAWLPRLTDKMGRRFRCYQTLTPAVDLLLLGYVLVLGVAQLWVIVRLRETQAVFAQSIGEEDVDGNWAFGQIVALLAFVPVFLDGICALLG